MEKRTQEEELQANVAAENEAAREAEKMPAGQDSSEAEKMPAKQDSSEAEKMPAKQDSSEEVFADDQYPIMGNSDVTAQQLAEYYNASGAKYPAEELGKGGADSIETFCQMYCEEAAAEGVRPEVAFVQAMKETAWLQYGGDAKIE